MSVYDITIPMLYLQVDGDAACVRCGGRIPIPVGSSLYEQDLRRIDSETIRVRFSFAPEDGSEPVSHECLIANPMFTGTTASGDTIVLGGDAVMLLSGMDVRADQ